MSRIYTDLATFEVTPQGLRVLDRVEGLAWEELQRLTGVALLGAQGVSRVRVSLDTKRYQS